MCLRCSTQGFIGKGLRLHLSALIHPAVSPIKTALERITNDADQRSFASPICVADRPGSSTSDCYRSVTSRAAPSRIWPATGSGGSQPMAKHIHSCGGCPGWFRANLDQR